ncbi:MAG: Fic family protein [Flavobacteriia bacterium]|nr:Fic family protein [Flavobacteriia bacterium]
MIYNHFLKAITVFQGRSLPEEGVITGYSAIIQIHNLDVPYPTRISIISSKNRRYNTPIWSVYTPRYQPYDSLYSYLVFALKNEGINLICLKKLFEKLKSETILDIIQIEPLGQYSRKIWFLYEWLMQIKLPISDLKIGNYVSAIDTKTQYALERGVKSSRHRIINNLPGTVDFCPLIFKSEKIEKLIDTNYSQQNSTNLKPFHKDLLHRAAAFLLLQDSKASFTIEGENPTNNRAMRWGKAIGKAGTKDLTIDELVRLQQIVIENTRFVTMGLRKEGGFVGEHDRMKGEPLPAHISAKPQDIQKLIKGLLETYNILETDHFHPVLTAASIAFGFVFIHPFADGNGRIHRYIIHHILDKMKFTQQGIIFPISASILNHITDYRKVLEAYSHSILDFIEWKKTNSNNVEVTNETIDYYRYYDATKQVEFLFDCVKDTIENIIPSEIKYIQQFDEMKRYLENVFEMPDNIVALLIRFLEQNNGNLSKRAKEKEFNQLNDKEIQEIEKNYKSIFLEIN